MSGFVAGQSLPAADLNAALVVKRVRVATTAAGTLASDFENGDTIDGVVLVTGNRILLKDQAAGATNGIYVVAASGAPTRAVDFDSSAEVLPNTMVVVSEGTANADTCWQLTTNATITLGTTALVFAQFGASSGASVESNNQTGTAYTLALTDAGKVVELNNAAAITLTVPPNSTVAFPVGTVIELWQQGAGAVTVAAGAGVTIRSPGGDLSLSGQYATASLRKRATDEWALEGRL